MNVHIICIKPNNCFFLIKRLPREFRRVTPKYVSNINLTLIIINCLKYPRIKGYTLDIHQQTLYVAVNYNGYTFQSLISLIY